MEVTVYTDASFCQWSNVASCGYLVVHDGRTIKHEITMMSGVRGSLSAECIAISFALQYCFLLKGVDSIIVVTEIDAFLFPEHKLSKNHKRNMKEVKEIVEIIKSHFIHVRFRHVRAHSNNKYNTIVDTSVRKALNDYRKENNIDPFILQVNHLKPKNPKSWV